MKFTNPFKKGKTMTEQNQNPETVETAEQQTAELSHEELQARVAELEGMLKDEQLRGLANEQNLRRRHQEELQAAHKFAAQRFAAVLAQYQRIAPTVVTRGTGFHWRADFVLLADALRDGVLTEYTTASPPPGGMAGRTGTPGGQGRGGGAGGWSRRPRRDSGE